MRSISLIVISASLVHSFSDERCFILSRFPAGSDAPATQCVIKIFEGADMCRRFVPKGPLGTRCHSSTDPIAFSCTCDSPDCPNTSPSVKEMFAKQLLRHKLWAPDRKHHPLHNCMNDATVQFPDADTSETSSDPAVPDDPTTPLSEEKVLTSDTPRPEVTSLPVDETSSSMSSVVPSAETSSPLSQSTEHHLSTQSHGAEESSTVRRLSEDSGETPEKEVSAESSSPAGPPSTPLSAEAASTLASTSSSEDRSPGGDVTSSEVNEVTTIKVAVTYSSETIDLGPAEVAEVTRPLVDSGTGTSPSPVLPVERPYDFTIIIIVASVLGPAVIICLSIAGCFWLTKRNRGGKFAAAERTPRVKGAEDVWRQIEEGVNQQVPAGSVAATSTAATSTAATSTAATSTAATSTAASPAVDVAPAAAPPQKPRKVKCHPHIKSEYRHIGPLVMHEPNRDGRPLAHAMEGEEAVSVMPPLIFDIASNGVAQIGSSREIYVYGLDRTQDNTDRTQSESIRMAEDGKKKNRARDSNRKEG